MKPRTTILLALFLVLALASTSLAEPTTTLCYDDTGSTTTCGNAHTFLQVPDSIMRTSLATIVCASFILIDAADSQTCANTATGVYYACAPTLNAYCNATITTWGATDYAFTVTATGASSATLSFGNMGAGNYTLTLDGTPSGQSFAGSSTQLVTITTTSVHTVEFAFTSSTTQGGSMGSGGGGGGGSGGGGVVASPNPVIVNVGSDGNILGPTGQAAVAASARGVQSAWWLSMLIGVALAVIGEPQVAHFGTFDLEDYLDRRHWLAFAGAFFFGVGLISWALQTL